MKKFACSFAITLLAFAALAQAQTKSAQPKASPQNVVVLSGKVSDDGTMFVNDSINKWTVVNSSSLKGKEGEHVAVRGRVDPDKHTNYILSVTPERVVKPNLSDSAFRR
jgi:hypothetical protein